MQEPRPWWMTLWLAVGYYLAALLVTSLPISSTYSTPVWPSAGLAMGLLWLDPRTWPGLWLGVFLHNGSRLATWGAADLVPVLALASGITLASVVTVALARRRLGPECPLIHPRELLWFFGITAILGPGFNGLCGVLTLVSFGLCPPEAWAATFWTWWVGDALGVLLFAPFPLLVWGRPRSLWRPRLATVAIPLLVAFAVLLLVFRSIDGWERDRQQGMLQARADEAMDQVRARLALAREALESVATFVALHDDLRQSRFDAFALRTLTRHDSLYSIAWAPEVAHAELGAFQERQRRIQPSYQVFWGQLSGPREPPPDVGVHTPLTLQSPLLPQRDARGLDLRSEVRRRDVVDRALSLGELQVSAPIDLVSDGGRACLLVAPTHDPGGVVCGVVRLEGLVAEALPVGALQARGLGVFLFDAHAGDSELWDDGQARSQRAGSPYTSQASIGGRTWELRLSPLGPEVATGWAAGVALFSGLGVVALLSLFLLQLTGRSREIERQVERRTRELEEANRALGAEVEQRERAEEALKAFNEELVTADQLKTNFLATVSHELRTPLTSIQGSLAILERELGTDQSPVVERFLDVCLRNSERLLHLINDLLDLQKIEAGSLHTEWSEVDPRALAEEVAGSLQGFSREGEARLSVRGEAPRFTTDANRLHQILTNLLSNALKFGGSTSPVELIVSQVEDRVRFEVLDRGPGVPPELREKIFSKFFQADNTSTRHQGGTGLGLPICKALIGQLEGAIGVAARDGGGACFWVELPMQGPASQAPAACGSDGPR